MKRKFLFSVSRVSSQKYPVPRSINIICILPFSPKNIESYYIHILQLYLLTTLAINHLLMAASLFFFSCTKFALASTYK